MGTAAALWCLNNINIKKKHENLDNKENKSITEMASYPDEPDSEIRRV